MAISSSPWTCTGVGCFCGLLILQVWVSLDIWDQPTYQRQETASMVRSDHSKHSSVTDPGFA